MEGEEREFLAKQLVLPKSEARMALEWAPRLRRLLSQALDLEESSRRALLGELLQREPHLIFVVGPDGGYAPWRSWPGVAKVLEVFPDISSARAVACGDDPEKTVTLGDLAPREVFVWMAKDGGGLAINVYSPNEAPCWVLLRPEEMESLAEGRLPNSPG